MMILKELECRLDKLFVKSRAESWDNPGLQVGSLDSRIDKVLVTLDVNEQVLSEAVKGSASLIISHHPLIFNPLKSVTDKTYGQKLIRALIKEDIAVYSAHTNYDCMPDGLGRYYSLSLGLEEVSCIQPYSQPWYQLAIFVPEGHEQEVRQAICQAGGGQWGNYSCCTFNSAGQGTFLPQQGAQPFIGQAGQLSVTPEIKIECIVSPDVLDKVLDEALKKHPYQQPAYHISKLENRFAQGGLGICGTLKKKMDIENFLAAISSSLGLGSFRWTTPKSGNNASNISRVAVVWGSANSLADSLMALDCQAVLVGEIGYHHALDLAAAGKTVIEIGHGCSEEWAMEDMYRRLVDYFGQEEVDIKVDKSKMGYMAWRYYSGKQF